MRLLTRSIALAAAILPFLPFTEWPTSMACVTALSPVVSLSAALGARHLALLTLMCLPLIILAFFKHRWFCWNLCPTGFILELTSLRRRAQEQLTAGRPASFACMAAGFPHLGKWLLVLGIGMAAAGYPLLIVFDPLNILSGFLSTWQWRNIEWKVFAPALPLLALVALNIFRPNLWCHRLCPLGVAQQFLGMAGRRFHNQPAPPQAEQVGFSGCSPSIGEAAKIQEPVPPPGVKRRFFLMALLGGMAGWALTVNKSRAVVVRPPGAVNENIFTGLCSRCGHCINVCPESIVIPDFGSSGLRGLLTPVLRYSRGYCNEWCSKCLLACPTTAIRRLSLEQKRATVIGTARIDKSLCLAWSKQQDCMVCQEFCPYQAVAIVKNGGVNCPEVKEEVCRGCGACESQCPAIPEKAITVRGAPAQRTVSVNYSPN
ncbi:MAG: 4Fe-4S binding protein [Kiritimatiellia bacterium]|nr:4Fe-4S binding protein [Kiritimatiellia bacterium]